MKNLPPGSPNLSIMSFQGGFHGRLLGALSTTRSKAIHKVLANWVIIQASPLPSSPLPLTPPTYYRHAIPIALLAAPHSQPCADWLQVDLPAFDWPVAPFPQIKYPLEQHAAHNAAEEERCIQAVRDTLIANPNCIAIVIEPIQGEGGTRSSSSSRRFPSEWSLSFRGGHAN
jgi:4-aminobutyrate aminotransferase/(S)-3-amino-2-methylpropionate transaminase